MSVQRSIHSHTSPHPQTHLPYVSTTINAVTHPLTHKPTCPMSVQLSIHSHTSLHSQTHLPYVSTTINTVTHSLTHPYSNTHKPTHSLSVQLSVLSYIPSPNPTLTHQQTHPPAIIIVVQLHMHADIHPIPLPLHTYKPIPTISTTANAVINPLTHPYSNTHKPTHSLSVQLSMHSHTSPYPHLPLHTNKPTPTCKYSLTRTSFSIRLNPIQPTHCVPLLTHIGHYYSGHVHTPPKVDPF